MPTVRSGLVASVSQQPGARCYPQPRPRESALRGRGPHETRPPRARHQLQAEESKSLMVLIRYIFKKKQNHIKFLN